VSDAGVRATCAIELSFRGFARILVQTGVAFRSVWPVVHTSVRPVVHPVIRPVLRLFGEEIEGVVKAFLGAGKRCP